MFRRFADWFNRMMYGRYGADALFYTLIFADLLCSLCSTVFRFRPLLLIGDLLLVFALIRYFSKNIYKRREENRKFLAVFSRVKTFFARQRDRIRDFKVCRYRRCPKCKAVLRLPVKRGTHYTNCPQCRHRFKVHIWF